MTFAVRLTQIIDWFYWRPFRRLVDKQTFRYAFCGCLNMAGDTVWYAVAYNLIFRRENLDLGFVVISPHIAALFLVVPVTFFVGFWLNTHITFRNSPLKNATQLFRYALSGLGAFILNYIFLKFFVEVCHIYPTPSKICTTILTVAYSYLMQKYFTFRGAQKE